MVVLGRKTRWAKSVASRWLVVGALCTTSCATRTQILLEVEGPDISSPFDSVTVVVFESESGALRLERSEQLDPSLSLPFSVVLEPSEEIAEALRIDVTLTNSGQVVAGAAAAGRFERGAINEISLVLQRIAP